MTIAKWNVSIVAIERGGRKVVRDTEGTGTISETS